MESIGPSRSDSSGAGAALVLWLLWRDRRRILDQAAEGIPDLLPVVGLLSVAWLFAPSSWSSTPRALRTTVRVRPMAVRSAMGVPTASDVAAPADDRAVTSDGS